jgi:hypothetical protein
MTRGANVICGRTMYVANGLTHSIEELMAPNAKLFVDVEVADVRKIDLKPIIIIGNKTILKNWGLLSGVMIIKYNSLGINPSSAVLDRSFQAPSRVIAELPCYSIVYYDMSPINKTLI